MAAAVGGSTVMWPYVIAGASMLFSNYQQQQALKQQKDLSQPLPTYLRYAWNPMQRQMYNWMAPMMGGMFGAKPGTIPSAANLAGQTDIAAFEKPPESRQYGGPVGQAPYLVGEAGPEVFVPEQRGQVIPLTPGQQRGPMTPGMQPGVPLTPRQYGGEVAPPGDQWLDPTAMPTPGTAVTESGKTFDPATQQAATTYDPATTTGATIYQKADIGQAPAPTAGWYSGLDPNVRAGIEEPYMRGMEMMGQQLQGRGAYGAQRAGPSGAAADVMGQYMQKAAPSMAMTGWGMMAPGLMEQQRQQYGAGQQAQQLTAGSQAQYAGAANQAALQSQQLGAGSQAQYAGAYNLSQQQAAGYGAQSTLQAQGSADQAAMLQQQQAWQGQMMPYQMLPAMLPYMMPEGITSTAEMPHFPGDPTDDYGAAGGVPQTGWGTGQYPAQNPDWNPDLGPWGGGGGPR